MKQFLRLCRPLVDPARRRCAAPFAAAALMAAAALSVAAALFAIPTFAAVPVVNATLEPAQISLGESAQLTISSAGNGLEGVNLPDVPGLQFRVIGRSQRISIINGATLAMTSAIVRVTPTAAGIYTIPGITPATQPLILKVNPAGSPSSPPGSSGSPGLWGPPGTPGSGGQSSGTSGLHLTTDGSAYARLTLPKRDIYVGESIPVDIEVGMRDGFVTSLNGLPTLTGSDFTLNNLSHQPEKTQRIIDGQRFTVYTWHSLIAGVKPGKFALAVEAPLTVRIRTRPQRESMLDDMLGDPFMQNFFGATIPKDITVTSPTAELGVLQLPTDGRPANFTGAVGSFKIASDLSATSAAAGDPLTLRMHVIGTGNFDRVDSTMLEHVDEWKTYPPKSSFKASDPLGNKGEKLFEQPVIASRPGAQTVPGLAFSYFDPAERRYVTAHTAPLDVTIVPPSAETAANGGNPAPSGSAPIGERGGTATESGANAWRPDHAATDTPVASLEPRYLEPTFLALPSLLALALALAGSWFALRGRSADAAPRRKPRPNEVLLADLDAAARRRDAAAFFELARTALEQTGGDDEDARRIVALADEVKFSRHRPTDADFDQSAAILRRLVTTAALVGLLVLVGPLRPAAASADDGAATSTGYTAATLYNQGNAFARAGKTGSAVLAYQRARLLAADDPDLDANLQRLRTSAHLPPDAPSDVERAVTALSPTAAYWVGVAGVVLLGCGLIAGGRHPRYRGAGRAAAFAGTACLAYAFSNAAVIVPVARSAVILVPATPARVSPVPMSDSIFTLPEGETVRVRAVHDEFVLVETRTGRTGWVGRTSLGLVADRAGG